MVLFCKPYLRQISSDNCVKDKKTVRLSPFFQTNFLLFSPPPISWEIVPDSSQAQFGSQAQP